MSNGWGVSKSAINQVIDPLAASSQPVKTALTAAQNVPIAKTMHLLALVDPMDDTYRRLMNRQLTVQESRHRLARAICHGGRGQIRQAYREGQEDQLAALGLVLNAVVVELGVYDEPIRFNILLPDYVAGHPPLALRA
jgi:TnpA family transposase